MENLLRNAVWDKRKQVNGSLTVIARGAGISLPCLSEFISGRSGMNLRTAEKLCRFLDLELRPVKGP